MAFEKLQPQDGQSSEETLFDVVRHDLKEDDRFMDDVWHQTALDGNEAYDILTFANKLAGNDAETKFAIMRTLLEHHAIENRRLALKELKEMMELPAYIQPPLMVALGGSALSQSSEVGLVPYPPEQGETNNTGISPAA